MEESHNYMLHKFIMLKDFINYLETISNRTCKNIVIVLVANVATNKLLNLAKDQLKIIVFQLFIKVKQNQDQLKALKFAI